MRIYKCLYIRKECMKEPSVFPSLFPFRKKPSYRNAQSLFPSLRYDWFFTPTYNEFYNGNYSGTLPREVMQDKAPSFRLDHDLS